jgi:hypothetical protein
MSRPFSMICTAKPHPAARLMSAEGACPSISVLGRERRLHTKFMFVDVPIRRRFPIYLM